MYYLALGTVCVATAFDLRARRIPNAVSGLLFVAACLLTAFGLHPLGASQAALGFTAAAVLSLPAYLKGWLGAGDVKLYMALGTTLGLMPFLLFFVAATIAGGWLAWRAHRRGQAELAYAPAMLVGLLTLLPLQWLP